MPQVIEWRARHRDGKSLSSKYDKYTSINSDKLDLFIVSFNSRVKAIVHFDGNRRLIYRTRTIKNALTGREEKVVLVGWQQNVKGKNIQCLNFIFEDGHVEIIDRFKENHDWFYPCNFLPQEIPQEIGEGV